MTDDAELRARIEAQVAARRAESGGTDEDHPVTKPPHPADREAVRAGLPRPRSLTPARPWSGENGDDPADDEIDATTSGASATDTRPTSRGTSGLGPDRPWLHGSASGEETPDEPDTSTSGAVAAPTGRGRLAPARPWERADAADQGADASAAPQPLQPSNPETVLQDMAAEVAQPPSAPEDELPPWARADEPVPELGPGPAVYTPGPEVYEPLPVTTEPARRRRFGRKRGTEGRDATEAVEPTLPAETPTPVEMSAPTYKRSADRGAEPEAPLSQPAEEAVPADEPPAVPSTYEPSTYEPAAYVPPVYEPMPEPEIPPWRQSSAAADSDLAGVPTWTPDVALEPIRPRPAAEPVADFPLPAPPEPPVVELPVVELPVVEPPVVEPPVVEPPVVEPPVVEPPRFADVLPEVPAPPAPTPEVVPVTEAVTEPESAAPESTGKPVDDVASQDEAEPRRRRALSWLLARAPEPEAPTAVPEAEAAPVAQPVTAAVPGPVVDEPTPLDVSDAPALDIEVADEQIVERSDPMPEPTSPAPSEAAATFAPGADLIARHAVADAADAAVAAEDAGPASGRRRSRLGLFGRRRGESADADDGPLELPEPDPAFDTPWGSSSSTPLRRQWETPALATPQPVLPTPEPPEPVTAPEPEPVAVFPDPPAPEPVTAPGPEPVAVFPEPIAPEPLTAPEPEPIAPEPVLAPEPEAVAPEREPEPAVVPEPQAVAPEREPEPAVVPEPQAVAPEPEPEPAVAPEPQAVAPEPEPDPVVAPEPQAVAPEPEPDPVVAPEPQAVAPEPEPDPVVVAEPQAVEPEPEPEPAVAPEPQAAEPEPEPIAPPVPAPVAVEPTPEVPRPRPRPRPVPDEVDDRPSLLKALAAPPVEPAAAKAPEPEEPAVLDKPAPPTPTRFGISGASAESADAPAALSARPTPPPKPSGTPPFGPLSGASVGRGIEGPDLSRFLEASEHQPEDDEREVDEEKARKRAAARTRLIQRLTRYAVVIVIAVLAALSLRTFVVSPYYIPSASMEPTLHGCDGCDDDHVLVDKVSYRFHDPNQKDIVVFSRPPGVAVKESVLIKRVIGLPGDVVSLRSGKVYINGAPLEEPYIRKACGARPSLPHGTTTRWTIPDNEVFVMGDNRCDSTDSRDFGPIKRSSIIGRAFAIIWPLGRIRML